MEEKALVVDVPIRAGEREIGASGQAAEGKQALEALKQCDHVRADGLRCGRRAAAGREQCEWHDKWNFQLMVHSGMPYPEDAISIQQVLAETMGLLLCKHITPEEARAVAALCREMRQNLVRFEWEMKRYQLISGEAPGQVKGPYRP